MALNGIIFYDFGITVKPYEIIQFEIRCALEKILCVFPLDQIKSPKENGTVQTRFKLK